MSAQLQPPHDELSDQLLEKALSATADYARSLRDPGHALEAWRVAHMLKALRRPEVVARMDAERMQRARVA